MGERKKKSVSINKWDGYFWWSFYLHLRIALLRQIHRCFHLLPVPLQCPEPSNTAMDLATNRLSIAENKWTKGMVEMNRSLMHSKGSEISDNIFASIKWRLANGYHQSLTIRIKVKIYQQNQTSAISSLTGSVLSMNQSKNVLYSKWRFRLVLCCLNCINFNRSLPSFHVIGVLFDDGPLTAPRQNSFVNVVLSKYGFSSKWKCMRYPDLMSSNSSTSNLDRKCKHSSSSSSKIPDIWGWLMNWNERDQLEKLIFYLWLAGCNACSIFASVIRTAVTQKFGMRFIMSFRFS